MIQVGMELIFNIQKQNFSELSKKLVIKFKSIFDHLKNKNYGLFKDEFIDYFCKPGFKEAEKELILFYALYIKKFVDNKENLVFIVKLIQDSCIVMPKNNRLEILSCSIGCMGVLAYFEATKLLSSIHHDPDAEEFFVRLRREHRISLKVFEEFIEKVPAKFRKIAI